MIEFADVSKRFVIDHDRPRSFQEKVIQTFRRSQRVPKEEFWALRGISFRLESGEALAIVGANGSGKSTILKLIARIIYPTSGSVHTEGRIAALLELGAGFHSDLTGRENIELNGSILGLSRRYVRHQLDDIVAFSELERFIDVPIRNYSSGMLMRLGFSVATAFQPDILLIDEVLAVGDQAFQDRCMRRIAEIQRKGATIVLVSHDLASVQKLCRRALWLDDGLACGDGRTEQVITKYLETLWRDQDQATSNGSPSNTDAAGSPKRNGRGAGRWGSGEVRIERAELRGDGGAATTVFRTGGRFAVRMWYSASRAVEKPAFGISIYDEVGNRINGPNTLWSALPIGSVQGTGYVDYAVDELPLLPGRYDLTVAVYDEFVVHPYDHWDRMLTFTVVPTNRERQDGVVFIPCHWQHRQADGP